MRRTERLFAILQILRAARGVVTAQHLADELEVSLRTIYRDTAELIAQRVPLRGDAGVGYLLGAGYELPPLALTADELDAALLGAAWVGQRGDASLARAARSLIEKLGQVVPKELQPQLLEASLRPAKARAAHADGIDLAVVRAAIRDRKKLEIDYADDAGRPTTRVIWPFLIGFMDDIRVVAAHCELRDGFRHFRTDRIRAARVLATRTPQSLRALTKRWELAFPGAPEPRAPFMLATSARGPARPSSSRPAAR
jgi:predicted DNA-binding transcriptional regulator YafY|nr:YafY family protein [Kofleriaceae bacterium]